ncbi:putative protease Do-like 14 [Gastrolobium bilobum]|uniref:putative protease Do-like 14 n=1 Tax=Gastrolobium bilobum TaxID=150636 RepID=UPI002AAFC9A5|nr:putative protease Do-like 14 [Gastrolobium bilobum]
MNISEETSVAVGDGSNSSDYFGRHTIANAAAKVGPSVVTIVVSQDLNGITTKRSIGSGTIIDKDGTILTCAHVVVDFQGTRSFYKGKVEVTLQDGRTFQGKVVNADMHSDIAIVKINSETPLPEAKLGSSSTLRPEDLVIAMGCTHSLQNTVTLGIVSCVDWKSSDLGFNGTPREYLQTDCAINVGNSGGPLVNMDGEVIGVNLMKMMVADGLSFSVPIDSVPKIIEHFKKNGCVDRKSSDLGFNGTPREYLQTDCAINEGNSGGPLVNMDGEIIGVNLMKMMAAVGCVDRKSSDLGFNGTPREYLQTDCAINEGNSGGPLVNMDGEVIGVSLMKMMATVGLSFSVPIDSVPKIIEHFKILMARQESIYK